MEVAAARVLRLFRLTVPPVFFLLACYVFLGEHVFGLAYVIAKRLNKHCFSTGLSIQLVPTPCVSWRPCSTLGSP